MAKVTKTTPIGGNVFADLHLPNADEHGARVRLGVAIHDILTAHKLTQAKAAKLLGINQPKVSALLNFRLEGFSVERLMHFLTALEHDVVIQIMPRRKSPASVSVKSKGLGTRPAKKARAVA